MNRRGFLAALATVPVVAVVPAAKAVPTFIDLPFLPLPDGPLFSGFSDASAGWSGIERIWMDGKLIWSSDDCDLSDGRCKLE